MIKIMIRDAGRVPAFFIALAVRLLAAKPSAAVGYERGVY